MTRQEELSKAAHEYILSDAVQVGNEKLAFGDFINGAKWAFEYMEKNRLTACDNMTEKEAEREQRFAINFLKENDRIPTFSDAIEITRKEMIEKACEWLEENLLNYWSQLNANNTNDFIKGFKQSIKGE